MEDDDENVAYIENQQCPNSVSKIRLCHAIKSLLSCCIPYLRLLNNIYICIIINSINKIYIVQEP